MTYGYRLNIEDIYLKSADEHWVVARDQMVEINDENPETEEVTTFNAPTSPEGLSSSVQAVVGWAICLESFINLAWNMSVANRMPSIGLNKYLMKRLSTIEKLKEILKMHEVSLEDKSWLVDLDSLFQLRNRLVHFKDTLEFVGFAFAPSYTKYFEENRMRVFRQALSDAICEVGSIVDMRTDFLNGDYEVVTYEE